MPVDGRQVRLSASRIISLLPPPLFAVPLVPSCLPTLVPSPSPGDFRFPSYGAEDDEGEGFDVDDLLFNVRALLLLILLLELWTFTLL